jgi:hypothetical protein
MPGAIFAFVEDVHVDAEARKVQSSSSTDRSFSWFVLKPGCCAPVSVVLSQAAAHVEALKDEIVLRRVSK